MNEELNDILLKKANVIVAPKTRNTMPEFNANSIHI